MNKTVKLRIELVNQTVQALDNIENLVDELKYSQDDEYDTKEMLIKQGLNLVKFILKTI